MTKLGAHIVTGSRNGYGQFCDAKPAVVLSTNDGGALVEAKQRSGDHTYTVFRDTVLYKDAPHGIDQMVPDEARALADQLYPQLKAKWLSNPADFYTCLNEPAGHNAGIMPTYIAFERRIMELAEADGFRLCVLNLATQTPDDGNVAGGNANGGIEAWKQIYVPHIAEAFARGHVYGRHAYDEGGMARVLQEAAYLLDQGFSGGLVVTELGLNGGYGYVGDQAFIGAALGWDVSMRQRANIIGGCMWTLGEGEWNANWQTAIPAVAQYMEESATPKWQPPIITPPPPPEPTETLEEWLWRIGSEKAPPNTTFGLHRALEASGYRPYENEWSATYEGAGYAVQRGYNEDWEMAVAGAKKPWGSAPVMLVTGEPEEPPAQQPFAIRAWPTDYKRITQTFGNNPAYYGQFGLPGHEGVDVRAPLGSPVYAADAGIVYRVTPDDNNYGIHVRIAHNDGFKTVYGHLAEALVAEGDVVGAGQQIGRADNTGNITSGSSHLHFTLKREGQPSPGWPADIVDPTPLLLPWNPSFPSLPPAEHGKTICDVSRHNNPRTASGVPKASINFTAMMRRGAHGCYIRGSIGKSGLDDAFALNWNGIAGTPLKRGMYHLWKRYSAEDNLANIKRVVAAHGHGDYRIAIDVEPVGGTRIDGNEVARFINLFRAEFGYDPLVYTGLWVMSYVDGDKSWFASSLLWLASYWPAPPQVGQYPSLPAGGSIDRLLAHQWTSTYHDGRQWGCASAGLDLNVVYDESRLLVASAPPPPPATTALLGLHASADPQLAPGELAVFQTADVEAVKLLHHMKPDDVTALVNALPGAQTWIVRIFFSWGNRNVSPAQFVGDNLFALKQCLARLAGKDVLIECHNEPNLRAEGLGWSWQGGASFATWLIEVLSRLRAALPGQRFMFPGLSPGGTVSGVRADHDQFLAAAMDAVRLCDAVGIHRYWGAGGETWQDAVAGVEHVVGNLRSAGVSAPVWVTEASDKSGDAGSVKGGRYVSFVEALSDVAGVTFFVASATHPDFQNEVWVKDGQSVGIAEVVGARVLAP